MGEVRRQGAAVSMVVQGLGPEVDPLCLAAMCLVVSWLRCADVSSGEAGFATYVWPGALVSR